MKKYKVIGIVITLMIFINEVLSLSYIYVPKETKKVDDSSISVESKVETPTFDFKSQSQYLIEPTTNTVLYANNENEKLLPASVTKVMSLLLIMEQIDSGKLAYTDMIKCSEKASKMGGSQIWFKHGEELAVEDCLKAICVVSANDCVVAMAEHISGSEENFVKMMNEKAKSLGMENTNFMNCHGIDEENHYTSAKDIAIMSRELIINHPNILKYTSIWMDTLRDGTFGLTNTNKLIRFYDGATGLKTGSTSQALFNLVATATRDNSTFLSVVMKAPSSAIRSEESTQLLNYAFSNFGVENIYEKNAVIEDKKIKKCIDDNAQIAIKDNISILKNKGQKVEVEQNLIYSDNITAPLQKGDVVGKIQVFDKNTREKLGEKDLICLNDIKKSDFKDYMKKMINIIASKNEI